MRICSVSSPYRQFSNDSDKVPNVAEIKEFLVLIGSLATGLGKTVITLTACFQSLQVVQQLEEAYRRIQPYGKFLVLIGSLATRIKLDNLISHQCFQSLQVVQQLGVSGIPASRTGEFLVLIGSLATIDDGSFIDITSLFLVLIGSLAT